MMSAYWIIQAPLESSTEQSNSWNNIGVFFKFTSSKSQSQVLLHNANMFQSAVKFTNQL
jgi:hypothetical protein